MQDSRAGRLSKRVLFLQEVEAAGDPQDLRSADGSHVPALQHAGQDAPPGIHTPRHQGEHTLIE